MYAIIQLDTDEFTSSVTTKSREHKWRRKRRPSPNSAVLKVINFKPAMKGTLAITKPKIWIKKRSIRLTQCCTQFKSFRVLRVLHLHDNAAFTFKSYGITVEKKVLFPKDLSWAQH